MRLPDVWRDEVMNPIGASPTWKWIPYDNAMVEVDVGGKKEKMPSISGGTRWGGGLWISTLDHARFGLLISRGHGVLLMLTLGAVLGWLLSLVDRDS